MVVFVVVAIVLVLMIGFLFVVFRSISRRLGKEAQKNAVRQIDIYDNLIAQKETELRKVRKQVLDLKSRRPIISAEEASTMGAQRGVGNITFPIMTGDYIDADFFEYYQQIRDGFGFDQRQCVKDVVAKHNLQQDARDKGATGEVFSRLLKKFSFDERYLLFTLSDEDQLKVLEDTFDAAEKKLLDEYVQHFGGYKGVEFFDWAERMADRGKGDIVVRTGHAGLDFADIDSRIKTVFDTSICEGVQIEIGDKLYDFSIQNMEMCK